MLWLKNVASKEMIKVQSFEKKLVGSRLEFKMNGW